MSGVGRATPKPPFGQITATRRTATVGWGQAAPMASHGGGLAAPTASSPTPSSRGRQTANSQTTPAGAAAAATMSRPQTASDGTRQSLVAEQSQFCSPCVAVGGRDGGGKRTARRHVHRCYSPLPITSGPERGLCGVRHMAKTLLEWYGRMVVDRGGVHGVFHPQHGVYAVRGERAGAAQPNEILVLNAGQSPVSALYHRRW